MKILLEQGRRDFEPLSYPARYGLLWEVWFKKLVLRFDLEGRIKEVVVQSTQELLRRTMGNRWLFYEWGNYDQTFALTGAYYLPRDMGEYPYVMGPGFREAATLLGKEMKATDSALLLKGLCELDASARRLKDLLGVNIAVLPPETLWIRYEILPVLISEGCLYGCHFCTVKGPIAYKTISRKEIREQIIGLADLYGQEAANLGGIFLGQNDALAAESELVLYGAETAWEVILSHSIRSYRGLYLFASPHSFLQCQFSLIESLDRLPYDGIHINIGLESPCEKTLNQLGKPINPVIVQDVIQKAMVLNRETAKVVVSLNFLISHQLPNSHIKALEDILSFQLKKTARGAVFLSPLTSLKNHGNPSSPFIRREVLRLKSLSVWPLYLYLIQAF